MKVNQSICVVACLAGMACFPALGQQYLIKTVAGGAPPVSPIVGYQASIGDPPRVAVDASGKVYFGSLSSVFAVDRSGILTRVAGTGRRGYSGDGGPATSAQLGVPNGIVADTSGNLYVSDPASNTVRRISASGIISTYAGNGSAGFSGDGGMATLAQLDGPNGLALDAAGNLYIADKNNNRIRVVSTDGGIATIAGNGAAGFWGDEGTARDAALNNPEGVALDAAGNLYIADTLNNRVRRVTADGTIKTFAGVGHGNVFGDNGPAVAAGLVLPTGVAVDRLGKVYISDFGNSRIRVVSPPGIISTVAGDANGAPLIGDQNAISAALNGPTGVAVDSQGNVYFTEGSIGSGTGLAEGDFRVWKVTADGVLNVLAGTGLASYSGDGGSSATAQLDNPSSVALDTAGNLYIADTRNHRIRKVTPAGIISTVAGSGVKGFSGDRGAAVGAQLNSPQGIAVDPNGNLLIADTGNSRIRRVTPEGTIDTIAGNGNSSYYGDGTGALQASVNHPQGIAVDGEGTVYIADTVDNAVRKIGSDGIITTLAGMGPPGFAGDGGPATRALLNAPTGVAVDSDGNVYIADSRNQRIRKVTPDGTITSVAVSIANPHSVATDRAGNVFVAAAGDHRVWMIARNRNPAPIAGTGECCYTGDGGPALSAQLFEPAGIAADPDGNVYVSDRSANAVRVLLPLVSTAPNLVSVVNGASNVSGPVTPGEVVVLYGTGLGPVQLTQGDGGTTVLFNGIPGKTLYSSALQVSAVAPASVTGPTVQIWVQYQNLATPALALPVADLAPALFTLDGSGRGQAAAQNFDASANSAGRPSGGILSLFATGLAPNTPLQVLVGGKPATVLSQSLVSAVLKITVQLPLGVQGGAVPVVIQSGSASSQDGVTIAIAGN